MYGLKIQLLSHPEHKQKERPRVRSGIYIPPPPIFSPCPTSSSYRLHSSIPLLHFTSPSFIHPNNNPQHTRNNPHSTRSPPHTRNNNTASLDTPSSSRGPSSAWAAGLVGTVVVAAGSTFVAGAEGRRIASAGLVGIGVAGGRSWEGC